jgi:hypothetical protein
MGTIIIEIYLKFLIICSILVSVDLKRKYNPIPLYAFPSLLTNALNVPQRMVFNMMSDMIQQINILSTLFNEEKDNSPRIIRLSHPTDTNIRIILKSKPAIINFWAIVT